MIIIIYLFPFATINKFCSMILWQVNRRSRSLRFYGLPSRPSNTWRKFSFRRTVCRLLNLFLVSCKPP
ncbi:hypothetical protein Hanom_Chr04g00376641 [Helianthus anomalus]